MGRELVVIDHGLHIEDCDNAARAMDCTERREGGAQQRPDKAEIDHDSSSIQPNLSPSPIELSLFMQSGDVLEVGPYCSQAHDALW